jgi:hypothetical protein
VLVLFEVMLCYYYFNQHQEYLFLKSVPFSYQHVLLPPFLPIIEKVVILYKDTYYGKFLIIQASDFFASILESDHHRTFSHGSRSCYGSGTASNDTKNR